MRKIVILLSCFGLLLAGLVSYFVYQASLLPKKLIEKYTQIQHYKIESQTIRKNEYLVERLLIDAKDGQQLLKKYQFKYGFNLDNFKGRQYTDQIQEAADNWYHLEETRKYGYVCLCLSDDKRHLTIVEVFGD